MNPLEKLLELGGTKRDIVFLVISGLALIVSGFDLFSLPFDAAWIAIILCGVPIILAAINGLVTAFDIKADVLVSMALVAAVIVGEDFAAGEVAFIMQLGALLEELTVAKARAGIERLVHLTPRTARIVHTDGTEHVVAAEEARVNDLIRVLPGETIPVDGVVVSGSTSINQAVMTGESLPVDKHPGDTVFSGTVNQFGAFDMRALKVGEDSSLQRMIRLVQSADASKAKSGPCRSLGNLGRGHCPRVRNPLLVCHRRNSALRDHPCGLLPLRPGAGNTHSHHGCHWQCHKTPLPCARGRCPGAPCHSEARGL